MQICCHWAVASFLGLGFRVGLFWDNGKENGNYYILVGYVLGLLYGDSGK